MAVGFRSYLRVDPGQSFLDTVIKHIDSWTADKQIDVEASRPGRYAIGNDDVLTIFREDMGETSVYRWRRWHTSAQPRDVWRTTFTAVQPPRTSGWLWTEIETRDDGITTEPTQYSCMSVPRVLRALLTELSCRDGRTDITAEPHWVASNHLPDLMDFLADESRLGPVYVASQGARTTEDFADWAIQVTWHLIGLGSVFLLDSSVAREFNDMVGRLHSVPAGTIRTYLPNVDLDDPLDPRRHKILGSGRIAESSPRRLGGMLGLIERIRAAHTPIPADAVELDRVLTAREHDMLPGRRRPGIRALNGSAAVSTGCVAVESASAAADLQRLHRELEQIKHEFGRHRIHQAAIVEQLEALVHEVQNLRRRLPPETPIPQRHLNVS